MHYDFIEIGTSYFSTLIETASDNTLGISVEPIKSYLDKLPSPPNVIKLPIGISFNNVFEEIEIYYLPDKYDDGINYPLWMFGCNSAGKPHDLHVFHQVTHLIEKIKVEAIPIGSLLEKYDVTSCDHLKIDTEGGDSDIILHLFDYIKQNPSRCSLPKRIQYETNYSYTPAVKIEKSRMAGQELGYNILFKDADTWLYKGDPPTFT